MSEEPRNGHLRSAQIRRATWGDAELLATVGARTFEDTFGPANTAADMAAYVSANFTPEKLAQELADASTRFLIAEIGGEVAGYAKLHGGDASDGVAGQRPIELSRIYVVSDWLGRGVGRALMQRCIDEAHSSRSDVLWLGVWERNERAISFYLKWGFTKVGEHDFLVGSDRQTDWVMARPV